MLCADFQQSSEEPAAARLYAPCLDPAGPKLHGRITRQGPGSSKRSLHPSCSEEMKLVTRSSRIVSCPASSLPSSAPHVAEVRLPEGAAGLGKWESGNITSVPAQCYGQEALRCKSSNRWKSHPEGRWRILLVFDRPSRELRVALLPEFQRHQTLAVKAIK